MRRRIGWLMAATTSAVVLSLVIPLCLLVRTLAEDRALAQADQEARNVAILVAQLDDTDQLPALVEASDARGAARTSLVLEDGQVLGFQESGLAQDPEVARARSGESFQVRDPQGVRILLPVVVADGTEVVRSEVLPADLHRGVMRAWLAIGAIGLVLLAVALVVGDRLARRISRPVRDVAETAHRLREGDLSARAGASGPPETQELGRALDGLAARITELLEAERAAVGDLSHRLRTPVTALRLDAEAVPDPVLAERLSRHIEVLQRDIDQIVREARRPVRQDLAARGDLRQVLLDRVEHWGPLAEDQGRTVGLDVAEGPIVVAVSEPDLRDLVDLLVDNVFAHTPEGVALALTLRVTGGRAVLEVADEGPGFAAAQPAGSRPGSTGLGLDIARRTALAGGGELVTEDRGGAVVRVDLPVETV